MIDVCIFSAIKKEIKSEVRRSDMRCVKGIWVSFWDLKVCKRILRGFSWDFLVLKVCYFEVVMLQCVLFLGCDATMCVIVKF
jgi:hypothetical protein